MRPLPQNTSLTPCLFLLLAWALIVFIYSQGWSGGWHFDDAPNLDNLAAVFGSGTIDRSAALEFVFSGDAGPLGRPIALASFLIDGSTWPHSPRALLYTNTLLHGINALLLCGVWLALLRLRSSNPRRSVWVAVVASMLWFLQPILVPGVLMAVQRMTLLSSSFMLLGAWLYLLGRGCLEQRTVLGWTLMLAGVGGGTLLGVLSKEQAALLPVLLWVLDRNLLPNPPLSPARQKWWRWFRVCAFYLPTLAICLYLLRIAFHADGAYANRDFNLYERLWTQAVILWDYLRLSLVPRALDFGPFHDDYPVLGPSWRTMLAVFAWLMVFSVCWRLRSKSRWPLFALLWFFVCHLVESTVVPLELYFEHRNYIAIAGPLLALVALAAEWAAGEKPRQYLATGLIGVYALLLAFVLWQVTSLFGENPVAARLWYEQHPHSVRAAQYLSGGLSEHGDVAAAQAILDETAARVPYYGGTLHLQGLQLACVLHANEDELKTRYDQVLSDLAQATRYFPVYKTLDKLKIISQQEGCNGFLHRDKLITLAQTALANDALAATPTDRSNLHFYLATLYVDERDLNSTMHHLEAAMQVLPQLKTVQIMVDVLLSAGLREEAAKLMDQFRPQWPKNPWLRKQQQQTWHKLRAQLDS